ncbi:MAG: ester cyclase, partial [Shimia sp.]
AALLADPAGAADHIAPDVVWDAAAPVDALRSPAEVAEAYLAPLRAALEGLHRRDVLFLGGDNRLPSGGRWVAAITHYVGNFTAPLWGLVPMHGMAFLRAGEFYRLDDAGRIAEAKILFDLPDLMRQAWRLPFPSLGTEITFPPPATQDGLCPGAPYDGDAFDVVERMAKTLGAYDPRTFASEGQTGEGGVWTDDMMWYGPGGIGSNHRWDGFVKDHRKPFLVSFPDRKGGHHFCRFGDSHYAAMGGWPSIHATWAHDYLGTKATGGPITMRVMDFYRIEAARLAENWVFIDIVDLFRQAGRDLIAEANAMAPDRPAP